MRGWKFISLLVCMILAVSACKSREPSPESTENQGNHSESTQAANTEAEIIEITNKTISDSGGKTLIAYFSLADIVPEGADASTHATPAIGNTESAAMEIQAQVGGELFAIKTVQSYPVSHSECSAIAEEELRSDARPELSDHVENMRDYETVYIGFPIWWYQEPMAVRTFLEEYDFSGKTIIPFCTTLGAGVEESEDNIAALCPDSTVLDGLTLRTGRENVSESVAEWLEEIGVTE